MKHLSGNGKQQVIADGNPYLRVYCILAGPVVPVQAGRDTRHRVLQGMYDRHTGGRQALSYHVHAVQQLDKV